MSNPDFDPYHEWLGIPPEEQPANHYRLLGLELFEADRGVIEAVSLEQIAHVRTFAIGANSEQSQLLLNELSAARVTLLNLAQKAEYDQDLRQQLNIAPPPVEVISESTQQTVNTPTQKHEPPPEEPNTVQRAPATSYTLSKQTFYITIGAGLALSLVILLSSILYLRAQRLNEAVTQFLNQGDYQAVLELDPRNEQALAIRETAYLIQFALNRRDYLTVLRLDPTNAQGLELKKAADLRRALADGDHSTALLLDPDNTKALAMKKLDDIDQALSRGDFAAALTLDPNNAVALAMKKTAADIQLALSAGDYAAALTLDPNNAAALAMKKTAADIQLALSAGDYEAVLKLDPGNAKALLMKPPDAANAPFDASNTAPPPAKAPFDAATAKEHQEAWAKYLGVEVETENSIGMKLSVIPPGTFTIGSDDGRDNEKPRHQVTLTKPFMLGTYEVTQDQYQRVIGTNPSKFKGVNNPVEMVSWTDAVEFCRRLSALPAEKAAGRVYRLPTEAQWEYACRAGTTTKYSFGDDESDLGDYAWYNANSRSTTHPVGGKLPNALGLHDMHGNVFEWCQDWYGAYPDRAVTDPTGTRTGSARVSRGGSWYYTAGNCRSAHRFRFIPSYRNLDYGFRVCLSPSGK
ncbi:SUMF1/EgtB/PvdO family nonheme iron enzyme [bacterium]|nr:SUMF1/EgtB/PvdO family nonheme iron enzyme [bacterium]